MSDQNVIKPGDRVKINLPAYKQWYSEHSYQRSSITELVYVQSLDIKGSTQYAIVQEGNLDSEGGYKGTIARIPLSFLIKIG